MANPENQESVEYNILIEATVALKNLADLTNATSSFNQKIVETTAAVKSASEQWGVDFETAKERLQSLDESMSGTAQSSVVFGGAGQAAWDKVGEASTQAGEQVSQSAKIMVGGIDLVKLALRFALIGALFEVVNAFRQMFTGAIDGLKTLEKSVYDLANAEKVLSQSGVDVTFKDLEDVVDRLHKKFSGLFSNTELQNVVSNIAIVTKGLGLTAEQIEKIAATAGALQLQHPEKSLTELATILTTSDMNGRLTALAKLGVNIDLIKSKEAELAAQLGVSTNQLTEQQKATIELEAAYQSVTGGVDLLGNKIPSLTAAQQQLKATWQDLLTTLGKDFAPLLIQGLKVLINFIQILNALLIKIEPAIQSFVSTIAAIGDATKGLGGLNKLDALMKFAQQYATAKKAYDDYYASFNNQPDTPTSNTLGGGEVQANENKAKAVAEAESKIQAIMQESADKKAQIELDYGRKLEDISRGYSQKLEDIARDTAQKREDALRAYNQKVDDINRNAAEEEARAKEDARQKEIDREKEYQQKLKELREKFLMDLEDALRNRDARQVLRLIRQYNMDKQNLADRKKLDEAQAKRDLAFKLRQIEQDRQLKLAAAKREYDDKLQEIAIGEQRALDEAKIWQQRQLEDANIWHQRQLQEYRQYLQQKLRDLANSLVKEYQLTAAGAAAIYQLLGSYFGTGGSISQLLGSSLTSGMNGILSGTSGVGGGSGGGAFANFADTFNTVTSGHGYGFAEGGTLIATRPTKALFGENGPERVDVTPLDRPGNNVGKVFGDRSAAGMNGNVKIRLELSPDLEARIVESSLDSVALTLEKVAREK